ncbi:MAG: DegT/DnrJ/EryC1/StrS family aminotransferase [Candidatus Omnitrophota bacterium]
MSKIRYESILIEQAFAPEYGNKLNEYLQQMGGLNDIKPLVHAFERDFAAYIGVKYAMAVNSGSDALAMILRAVGVGRGDEVIVPDLTYHAVALAVIYCGAKPVFVDVNADDLLLNVNGVVLAVTGRTKAIIAAHMFGRACDMEALQKLCQKKGIVLVEDVCQAESSTLNGRMLGSFGDFGAFSFSYYKPLSSCGGGGGMVVFNDEKYRSIARWMEDWRDDVALLKLGQRFAPMAFMDLVALRVKFSHLKRIIAARKSVKGLYEKALSKMPALEIFKDRTGVDSVPQNFVVCSDRRDALMDFLSANEIVAQKPYKPLHAMAAYRKFLRGEFPVSERYYQRALHLPVYSFMSKEKVIRVVDVCRKFFKSE